MAIDDDRSTAPDSGAREHVNPPGKAAVGYLPTLDGWRAVAILAVLLNHSRGHFAGASSLPLRTIGQIANRGYLGVDLFFGLSGLLITTLLVAEREKTGRVDFRRFYVHRAFRIVPACYAYLLAIGVLAILGCQGLDARGYPSAFLFLRNYVAADSSATEHLWSLAAEMHFYLAWPLLLCAAGTTARARRLAMGLALAAMAWRAADLRWDIESAPGLPEVWTFVRTDQRVDGLLLGCWMALVLADPSRRAVAARWLRPARVLAAAGVLSVLAFALPERLPAFRSLALPKAWAATVSPLLLASTMLHPGSILGRSLEWGPMRWLGRISYSLYLWQQLFLLNAQQLGPLGWFPLDWAVSVAFAVASYYLIERPAIAAGRRLVLASEAPRPCPLDPSREAEAPAEPTGRRGPSWMAWAWPASAVR